MQIQVYRKTEHVISSLILNRWSPRAMSGERISQEELLILFEAARWAPSSNNNQPWRFLYAQRETSEWDIFFNLLTTANKTWCQQAAVLIVVASKKTFDYNGKPSITHSFDTGAAWENFALQGSLMGLVVHGMQGFDYQRAQNDLDIPEEYTVEAMIAVGKLGKKEDLPVELQAREFPSSRKELSAFVFKGKFPHQ